MQNRFSSAASLCLLVRIRLWDVKVCHGIEYRQIMSMLLDPFSGEDAYYVTRENELSYFTLKVLSKIFFSKCTNTQSKKVFWHVVTT